MNKKDELNFAIIACLTLGLAPFVPEPHIVGKLRWLAGGGVGMKTMDYLDLAWHSLPWIFLFFVVIKKALKNKSKATKKSNSTIIK